MADQAQTGAARRATKRAAAAGRSAMADVLVVEGQTLVRRMAAEALRDAGLRVAEADCAEAALRAVDAAPERPPDVLVTAVTLGPGALDGRALAAELRRRSPGLGVVYLGGRPAADPAADDAPDARERFLPRPFEPARLARIVCGMAPPCPNPPRRVRGMDVMR
jgi:DNA-binding NtrC family response regulator